MSVKKETAGFSSRSPAGLLESAISAYSLRPADSPVNTPKFRSLVLKMLSAFARSYPTEPESLKILSAGMRSVVLALKLTDGQQVVLKHFRRRDSASNSGGFGYLREKHGLISLDTLVSGSYARLIFADDDARLLCTEYVPGTALASFLVGEQDEFSPASALDAWLDFWVGILKSPAQESACQAFVSALAEADPQAVSPGSLPSPNLAFKGLAKVCCAEGIGVDSAKFHERKTQLESIIYPAARNLVFSSGDFSPANILADSLSAPTVVRGIDAEGSALHHWALAVAEFLLGFPSCPWAPFYESLVQGEIWQSKVTRFYRKVCPDLPAEKPLDDAQVRAAVLTLQCILAEQTA